MSLWRTLAAQWLGASGRSETDEAIARLCPDPAASSGVAAPEPAPERACHAANAPCPAEREAA